MATNLCNENILLHVELLNSHCTKMAEILPPAFLHSNMATTQQNHSLLYFVFSNYAHFGQGFISKIQIIILLGEEILRS
jgi:hypothetical protein